MWAAGGLSGRLGGAKRLMLSLALLEAPGVPLVGTLSDIFWVLRKGNSVGSIVRLWWRGTEALGGSCKAWAGRRDASLEGVKGRTGQERREFTALDCNGGGWVELDSQWTRSRSRESGRKKAVSLDSNPGTAVVQAADGPRVQYWVAEGGRMSMV